MYVHLHWFTVWNKFWSACTTKLNFFATLNISTTHKWTNGYVIQMQMQKLQILTLAIPSANKGNASTWRGYILSAERKRLHLLFQLQRGHSAAKRCSVPYSLCTITACLHIFNDFRNTITCKYKSDVISILRYKIISILDTLLIIHPWWGNTKRDMYEGYEGRLRCHIGILYCLAD